eukprot:970961-Pyramimonas_sp.AAC.1
MSTPTPSAPGADDGSESSRRATSIDIAQMLFGPDRLSSSAPIGPACVTDSPAPSDYGCDSLEEDGRSDQVYPPVPAPIGSSCPGYILPSRLRLVRVTRRSR